MKECTCADSWESAGERWYPKRLLDLGEIRGIRGIGDRDSLTVLSEQSDIERAKVYLVETDEVFMQSRYVPSNLTVKAWNSDRTKMGRIGREDGRYVTLSHCWGRPKGVQGQLKLNVTNKERFIREGIELRELPKTFRDAILFACHLEKVGFIWIDSMCIMQSTEDHISRSMVHVGDWLDQSRQMDQIYQGSFLNISATAAVDGDQGLFFNRPPESLWENEINVNHTGMAPFEQNTIEGSNAEQLTRCALIDVSFWDELVESAAVNRRGWVLQERLMAPRVLHFCRDQVAWECSHFDDAEAYPGMAIGLRSKLGATVDEGRLKDLTLEAGRALRSNRLNDLPDPDEGMVDLYIYELWKHIVEVYSKTQITVPGDKLIALSGIARRFCSDEKLFTVPNTYLAGLWKNNLESQLLWQVNELFRDGVFENPGRRNANRAPSFSWASIDTPHGITYPDVTDYGTARVNKKRNGYQGYKEDSHPGQELMLQVLDYYIILSDPNNEYGMVEQGKLLLRPRYLRAITLRKLHPLFRVGYSWRLKQDETKPGKSQPDSNRSARHLEHVNLYLDAPESDGDIFSDNAQLYCMPVAYGERTVRKAFRYLYCLLLKFEGPTEFGTGGNGPGVELQSITRHPTFKRIGITKLSNHLDARGQEALMSTEYMSTICLC
jgi:hypothetical protein